VPRSKQRRKQEHPLVPSVGQAIIRFESVKVITAKASRRIAAFAFEYAQQHKRRKVTAIHKANIMKLSDGRFLACARSIAKRYPRIQYQEMIVDNARMQLVLHPSQFGVLLLENLYGDIVSDLCAGLVGGLGVVPGANLGLRYAIFEAVHGTAPDIAGKNLANPVAAIMSAVLMLRHLGEDAAAGRIQAAIASVVGKKGQRTRDLGGSASTVEVTQAIIAALHS
jgi:isocitrate dehydrogenase (NAD+)